MAAARRRTRSGSRSTSTRWSTPRTGCSVCRSSSSTSPRPGRCSTRWSQTNRQLEAAYEELQSTNEELETTNEELQSTVEELETTNEELQSTNEELETMNEELQSTNDELHTINDTLARAQRRTRRCPDLPATRWSTRCTSGWWWSIARCGWWCGTTAARSCGVCAPTRSTGEALTTLDIGLPMDQVQPLIGNAFVDAESPGEIVVDAVNRRGRATRVRVTLQQFPIVRRCRDRRNAVDGSTDLIRL